MAADTPRRILVVGARGIAGDEGGIEKFAEEFVNRAGLTHDLVVLCLNPAPPPTPRVMIDLVRRSRLLKTDKAFYLLRALWLYATRRFDCVFILGMNFGVLIPALRAMMWRRARIVMRSGSIDYTLPKWGQGMRRVMLFAERMMRRADAVIAVAPNIQRHLRRQGIASQLIRNGLERVVSDHSGHREPATVLAVGRITAQKNYSALVEAAALLGAEGPAITIVGGADLSDEAARLQAMLAAAPSAKLTFTGALPRAEVLREMNRKALFVNCSLHEGMSNSVLEAIQQGMPLLLSDIEANRDLGLPDRFYVAPSNFAAWADRIAQALADPDSYTVAPSLFDDWDTVIARVMAVVVPPLEQAAPGGAPGAWT